MSQEQEHAWEVEEREPQCDREVFESIKARVVREFNLGAEYVDVLNSAVARFPGDEDIVASANYLRYNRAVQGALEVGDMLPMDDITLASLDGKRIEHIQLSNPIPPMELGLSWPRHRPLSPAAKAFRELAQSYSA